MKILIVEDDYDKIDKIREFIKEKFTPPADIIITESLRAALKTITTAQNIDLVILDMSLPNFDTSADDPGGGTPDSFAGKELLSQMSLRGVNIPVAVLTQYSVFDEGRITLDELKAEFAKDFNQFYLGAVYYNAAIDGWKSELSKLIDDKFTGR